MAGPDHRRRHPHRRHRLEHPRLDSRAHRRPGGAAPRRRQQGSPLDRLRHARHASTSRSSQVDRASAQVLGTITAAGNNEEVNVARTKVQQLQNQRHATAASTPAGTRAAAQSADRPAARRPRPQAPRPAAGPGRSGPPRAAVRGRRRSPRSAWKAHAAGQRGAVADHRPQGPDFGRGRPHPLGAGSSGAWLETQIRDREAELRRVLGPGRLAGIADQHRRRPGHRSAQDASATPSPRTTSWPCSRTSPRPSRSSPSSPPTVGKRIKAGMNDRGLADRREARGVRLHARRRLASAASSSASREA